MALVALGAPLSIAGAATTVGSFGLGGVIAAGAGGFVQRMREQKKRKGSANLDKHRKSKVARMQQGSFAPTKMGKSTVNALAHRASMKVVGKKNVKKPGKKPVKVSKSLRKKVEKVIESKKCFGRYDKFHSGFIGVGRSAGVANVNVTQDAYGVAGQIATIRVGDDPDTGASRCWWGHMQSGTAFERGDDFNFFTPMKIIDAASVLWCNKTGTKDYNVTLGNFQPTTVLATGAPVVGTGNAYGQTIHIINSYVQFEMKNLSQRALKIEVYNCTLKLKYGQNAPLTTFELATRAQTAVANITNRFIIGEPIAAIDFDSAMNNPSIPPKAYDNFNNIWKYERVEMVINPGETCVHSVQGPRNYTVDYSKIMNANNLPLPVSYAGLYKPTTVSVMISVMPDLQYATAGTDAPGGTGTGRWWPPSASMPDNQTGLPLAIEFREVYKLSMPENTGFITQAGVGGTQQQLNSRRPVSAFANFARGYAKATIAYGGFDEENPAAAKANSLIF